MSADKTQVALWRKVRGGRAFVLAQMTFCNHFEDAGIRHYQAFLAMAHGLVCPRSLPEPCCRRSERNQRVASEGSTFSPGDFRISTVDFRPDASSLSQTGEGDRL